MIEIDTDRRRRVRLLAWGAFAALILLPLFAMKLGDPRAWQVGDLPFAFVMIAAVGLAFEFALRAPAGWAYRAGIALAFGATFLLMAGNLAVGFAGSEDNRINIIFFAVPALALIGSLAVGFRPASLAKVMAVVAVAQLVAGLIAFYHGHFSGPLTITFAGLWLASGLLFLRSSVSPSGSRGAV